MEANICLYVWLLERQCGYGAFLNNSGEQTQDETFIVKICLPESQSAIVFLLFLPPHPLSPRKGNK